MSQGVPLWMGCFEEELQKSLRGVIRHPFFFLFLFLKRWPKGGQNWDIKEKRFCIFAHFELLAKSLWCPEQDLNLHSFRNTHLKRARLPIPPPGHLVATHHLGRIKKATSVALCPGQDLNLHPVTRTTPSK